jgi:hypothetical protein
MKTIPTVADYTTLAAVQVEKWEWVETVCPLQIGTGAGMASYVPRYTQLGDDQPLQDRLNWRAP